MVRPNDYGGLNDEQMKLHAAATLTATENGPALDLGAGYAPDGGGWPMQAAIKVTAIKTSAGNETYVFKLQDSPDGTTWTDRSPGVAATAVGVVLVEGFVTAEFQRLVTTIAGTAPTITFADVYLNPITNG